MEEWFKDWFDGDYAAIYAHRDEAEASAAVDMALARAPGLAGGHVLDLACGAGRHLKALQTRNPRAFGMDLSRELLGLAPPVLDGRLIRGDMRRIPLREGSLPGICLWFTPFGYFSDGENRALLAHLGSLLAPGGTLLMDYLNARRVREELVPEDTVEKGGFRIHSRRTLEGDRVVKRMVLTRLDTGAVREATESVRIYDPGAMRDLGRGAGLDFREAVGAYDGSPFAPSSPRWIGFFGRPA